MTTVKRGNPFRRPKGNRVHGKKEWERDHSILRAQERYGIQLTTADLFRMVGLIHNNQAIHLKTSSHTRSVKLLENFKTSFGRVIPRLVVVYDKTRKMICTILPEDAKEALTTLSA